jgi:putative FmdB family regulatory protein
MPIYEFHCIACDKNFEAISKPADPISCKYCGTFEVKKEITAHAVYHINGDNSGSTKPNSKPKGYEHQGIPAERQKDVEILM